MTTRSELAQRAEAQAHDITSPTAAEVLLGAPAQGKEVARCLNARHDFVIEVPLEVAGTDYTKVMVPVPANRFPSGAKVVAITARTSAAVTAADATGNTYTFNSVDVNGVNPLAAATFLTTVTGGHIGAASVAFKAYSATLSATAANRVIPAGGALTMVRTHAGAGTAVPLGSSFHVVLEAL
jgi:hypothetical protein